MKVLENLQEFVGKTIKSIEDTSCNCITIDFTDGTSVLLEAENIMPSIGMVGIVPYSLVKEEMV